MCFQYCAILCHYPIYVEKKHNLDLIKTPTPQQYQLIFALSKTKLIDANY